MTDDGDPASMFRPVPRTGVIFVMTEAGRAGYQGGAPDWTNFGQGQPEVGPLVGAPERVTNVDVSVDDHEYAPVAGLWELREAVASHYNELYRRGMPSQYSAENVCISGGGRVALTRVAASLGAVNLGHFLPDYTAYEELLSLFRLFSPIPILLDPDRGYDFSIEELRREVLGRGLSALLVSNPCNPTGKAISGETLRGWTSIARRFGLKREQKTMIRRIARSSGTPASAMLISEHAFDAALARAQASAGTAPDGADAQTITRLRARLFAE